LTAKTTVLSSLEEGVSEDSVLEVSLPLEVGNEDESIDEAKTGKK
jgi:hypothetical protein